MSWAKWVLIGWYAFSAIVTVAWIGKPRDPGTPKGAAVSLVLFGLIVGLVETA